MSEDIKHVVGIDPSYSGLGVVVIDEKGRHAAKVFKRGPQGKSIRSRVGRVAWLCREVNEYLEDIRISAIAIEDYVVNREQPATTILTVELCFSLRFDLTTIEPMCGDDEIPIFEIPVSSLKQFVAGSGATRGPNKVTKAVMRDAVIDLYGHAFGNDNVVDAYGLAMFAAVGVGWWKAKNQKQVDAVKGAIDRDVTFPKSVLTMSSSASAPGSDDPPF